METQIIYQNENYTILDQWVKIELNEEKPIIFYEIDLLVHIIWLDISKSKNPCQLLTRYYVYAIM